MTEPDRLIEWQCQRQRVAIPDQFADRVMQAIHSELKGRTFARSRPASLSSMLALAAGVLFIILCHAGTVGLGLFALMGVAK